LRNPHHQQEQWNSHLSMMPGMSLRGLANPRRTPVAAPNQKRPDATAQLDNLVCRRAALPRDRRRPHRRNRMPPRHRFLEPIHNVKKGRIRVQILKER